MQRINNLRSTGQKLMRPFTERIIQIKTGQTGIHKSPGVINVQHYLPLPSSPIRWHLKTVQRPQFLSHKIFLKAMFGWLVKQPGCATASRQNTQLSKIGYGSGGKQSLYDVLLNAKGKLEITGPGYFEIEKKPEGCDDTIQAGTSDKTDYQEPLLHLTMRWRQKSSMKNYEG